MVIFLLGLHLGWNYVGAQNLFLKPKHYINNLTMCHHKSPTIFLSKYTFISGEKVLYFTA
jgi:hypothetical protein